MTENRGAPESAPDLPPKDNLSHPLKMAIICGLAAQVLLAIGQLLLGTALLLHIHAHAICVSR